MPNEDIDKEFDIAAFLGMPEYHDFEIQSENILDTSICIYRAKSINSERQVVIKVSTVPNDEENDALEEEYRILTSLKQQMAANTAPTAQNRIRRKTGSFVRRQSFSKNMFSMHSTIEDSSPISTFPTILEMKKVYGNQCVAILFEKFGGQVLESIIHGNFNREELEKSEMFIENSVTSNLITEEYSVMTPPLFYESIIPFDHLVSVFYQIAYMIDWLHRSKVALQNFSPANVLVKRIPGRLYPVVQLANFSLARKFENVGEVQHFLDFRYISPEQTERMDRITDYRTDMYSFGISMWEAFTRELPYEDRDVDELMYAHLTTKAADPRTKNPTIPKQLVDIIDKLIQKNPADRYQLFSAIKHDLKEILERCLAIRGDHSISTDSFIPDELLLLNFEKWGWNLGVKDFSPFLQFRAKTYGRKDQQTQILNAYEKWYSQPAIERQGKVIVLSGDYGTGKSAFQEDLCAAAKPGAYPISSRPTKVQENAPYKSFISIMEQLVAYVLGENNLSNWENILKEDLGTQGLRILHTLVPSISSVVTKIDFSRGLGMAVDKLDLFKVVEIFLGQFANYQFPLLLCLGELDPEANDVEILSHLLTSSLSYRCFFVLGLAPTKDLSSLKLAESSMVHINIPPLVLSEVVEFLDEILRPRLMEINSLATHLLQKSAGNLLYLKELVKHCEKLEIISFDQAQLMWTWDLKKIEGEVGTSNDFVSLLSRQIESLPAKLKRCLAVASCIGLEFDVRLLSLLVGEHVSQLNGILHIGVTKGYIQPLSNLNPALSVSEIPLQKNTSTGSLASNVGSVNALAALADIFQRKYRFCHRRIREFLRNHVSKSEFECYSLQIAHFFTKQKVDERMSSDQMYELLDHYENAAAIIKEDEDLLNYGQMLCDVGFKKGASTHQHIQNFIKASSIANSIVANNLQKQELLFKINTSLSKLYIRDNQLKEAEKLLNEVEQNNWNIETQRNEWTCLMVQLYVANNLLKEAIEIGFNSNSSFGFIFQALSFSDLNHNLKKLSHLISSKEFLIVKPAANIKNAQYADEMIQNCIYICKMRDDKKNEALFIMMGVCFSIMEGPTDNSSFYFASIVQYFVGSIFDYYDTASAKAYGELALTYMDRVSPERKLITFDALLSGYTIFWNYTDASEKMHIIFGINLEEKRVVPVIESMVYFYQNYFLTSGKTIGLIRDVDRKFRSNPLMQNQDYHEWDIVCRCFEDIASGTPIIQYAPINTHLGKFNYYAQLIQAFVYFLPNRSELCKKFKEFLSDFQSTWIYADALLCSIIAKCDQLYEIEDVLEADRKKLLITSIDEDIDLLKVYTHCQFSGEYRFKLAMAKAEKERALGNIKEGVEKYEEAFEGAQATGNVLFAAWINELYANFWISCNSKRISKTFLQTSITFWEQWGSDGKIENINARFPEHFKKAVISSTGRRYSTIGATGGRRMSTRFSPAHPIPVEPENQADTIQTNSNSFSTNAISRNPLALDINTFLKVTNSITNEKDLDSLVDKTLQHLMSTTGATKAVILFSSQGIMTLHKILTNIGIESFNPSEPQNHVPMSLIYYTTRISETQGHTEVTKEAIFSGDPYIEQFSPKSIICCPIKHQNQTTGAIYLENRTQAGVFTTARVALVKSLMASASIAIANAHLERKNLELSQALKESGKSKNEGPAYNVETPMQKVFEYVKIIKERFDPKDPIIKTFDSFLSTLTSDGLFAANLGEANDKDGKGIDQDVKNWVESSLLMTSKYTRAPKDEKDAQPRSSIIPAPQIILEEPNNNSSTSKNTNDGVSVDLKKINAELELASSPNFDCFRLHEVTEGRPLYHLGNFMLKKYKLYNEFKLNSQTIEMFLQRIESSYNRLPYHNSIHATDVLQSVEMILLDNNEIAKHLTPLEIFSVCIASAVHDLDHPGINNNFLVKIGHPLANLYNDNAVLESHHIAKAFEIAFLPKMTIFETMTPDQYALSRKMIIQIVMATDLAQHFQFISKFNGKVASSSLNLDDENDRMLVMEMAVKCGDLGNPAKSFDQAKKWTNLVMEEFFRQGDREKQMGYPVSKFMDRSDTNISKCQIGFIDFLVTPLFNSWTSFSKTEFTKLCQVNIENNRKQWNLIADDPNALPGVTSSDYEALEDLINITVPSISFGKQSNDSIRRKSMRDSMRKFSVGKFPTFSPNANESDDRAVKQTPLLSLARQVTD